MTRWPARSSPTARRAWAMQRGRTESLAASPGQRVRSSSPFETTRSRWRSRWRRTSKTRGSTGTACPPRRSSKRSWSTSQSANARTMGPRVPRRPASGSRPQEILKSPSGPGAGWSACWGCPSKETHWRSPMQPQADAPYVPAPPPPPRPLEWRRSLALVRALIADPDQTDLVYELFDAMGGRGDEATFAALRREPHGARAPQRPALAPRGALRRRGARSAPRGLARARLPGLRRGAWLHARRAPRGERARPRPPQRAPRRGPALLLRARRT